MNGWPRARWIDVALVVKAGESYKLYSLDTDAYLKQFYIPAAGAQVFGHYNPYGNHWFAHAVKDAMVDWLDPKPPAYCR